MFEVWIKGLDGYDYLYYRSRSEEKCREYLESFKADVITRARILKHSEAKNMKMNPDVL